ncbi:MAG TPA: PEGA domain-containing protein [Kofleriaceae bacterium]|jgi:hypothetical protein|nr:PEGA domain-containing protein [Kofleriaceae bacterium]
MSKALSLLCVCLAFLICSGGSARADKPKIAVLGLEVAPGLGGTVDPATTQIAKDITRELRTRAQSGSSPYIIAPNSNKELTDEKLLLSCDNEGRDCMAVIGAGLAADVMLYGRVEKKGELYKVTLKLFDVKNKTFESRTDDMPVGGSPVGVSKRLYGKLITDTVSEGSLTIAARSDAGKSVDGGKVMIDDERAGDLAGGKLTLPSVAEGRHVVAIESGGFRRFEETVTVHAGQPTRVDATLVARGASTASASSSSSHAAVWRVTLGASLAAAAIGGVYWRYAVDKSKDPAPVFDGPSDAAAPGPSSCGKFDEKTGLIQDSNLRLITPKIFEHSCEWHTRQYYGVTALAVGVVGTVASAILLILDHGSGEKAVAARRGKASIALTPVLTSDQAGASLSIRW